MVILSEEYIKEITQEVTGALSSHGVVSIIGLTAGGATMLADPIIGVILLAISIVYGSILKVKAGKLFKEKIEPESTPKHIENYQIIKTKSSRIAMLRYLTRSLSKIKPI